MWGVNNEKLATFPLSNYNNSVMVLLKESVSIIYYLSTYHLEWRILQNIYVKIDHIFKLLVTLISMTVVCLPVFYHNDLSSTNYKLTLMFQNGTGMDHWRIISIILSQWNRPVINILNNNFYTHIWFSHVVWTNIMSSHFEVNILQISYKYSQ